MEQTQEQTENPICECGHNKSEHYSRKLVGSKVGKGCSDCPCKKFTPRQDNEMQEIRNKGIDNNRQVREEVNNKESKLRAEDLI